MDNSTSEPESSFPIDAKRLAVLDGLRGLAISLVVLYDYFVSFYDPTLHPGSLFVLVHHFFEVGWCGVDLFFVLSGFLIGGLLLDYREAGNYYRTFFVRRTCRIFPLYGILLLPLFLAPLLLDWLPGITNYISSGDIAPVWHLIFAQNIVMGVLGSFGERWIATTWSLAVEEQFYLFAPAFIRWIKLSTLPWVLCGLVLFSPILRVILMCILPGHHAVVAGYVLLPCRWDALLLGVLAAYLARRAGGLALNHQKRVVALFWVGAVATVAFVSFSPKFDSYAMSSVGHTVLSLFFTALLLYCVLYRPLIRRLLEWKPLCWLGLISYAVYLFHEPVVSVLFEVVFRRQRVIENVGDVAVAVLALAITLGLAAFSWRYFERPIIQLGRRFRYAPA